MAEAAVVTKSARRLSAHPFRGYAYIAGSAVFWGISASLGRAAFTGRLFPSSGIERISPLILSQARTGFSFVVVAIVLLTLRGPRGLRMPWRDLLKLLALGLGGIAVSNYFYYLAIERTNVATAIIVQYTAPVWVLLYMLARRIEKPTISKMVSVVLAIAGIALCNRAGWTRKTTSRFGRCNRCPDRIIFVRLLQHRRPFNPCTLRSLDGAPVYDAGSIAVLDLR